MRADYLGESVAARYEASSADMFDPAVVDPPADFLAALAAEGGAEASALEFGTGLGCISLSPAIRHPRKKPEGADLTGQQTTYNKEAIPWNPSR